MDEILHIFLLAPSAFAPSTVLRHNRLNLQTPRSTFPVIQMNKVHYYRYYVRNDILFVACLTQIMLLNLLFFQEKFNQQIV